MKPIIRVENLTHTYGENTPFCRSAVKNVNMEILEEIITMEGASCEIVENGRLAVERFEKSGEGEFDAILMDIQMPVMN